MYNYTGFIDCAKECFICGIFAFIAFNPFTEKNRKEKRWLVGTGFLIIFAIFGALHLSCINSEDITVFTGEYYSEKSRDRSFACDTYYFKNDEMTRAIDITNNTRYELYNDYFVKGETYTLYYVTTPVGGNICIRIEEGKPSD
ncbi:MAG: hypothetical protein IJA70_07380 [Oscillospiraceae bacterium]|nr:hypothetical protein [Oscillospiraceae bacterium]